jgi:hypothetical protein
VKTRAQTTIRFRLSWLESNCNHRVIRRLAVALCQLGQPEKALERSIPWRHRLKRAISSFCKASCTTRWSSLTRLPSLFGWRPDKLVYIFFWDLRFKHSLNFGKVL